MFKKSIVIVGVFNVLITSVILSFLLEVEVFELLKSFFSVLQLLIVIVVLILDFDMFHRLQKVMVLSAFIIYPITVVAVETQLFGDHSFFIGALFSWLYMMGVCGLLYTKFKILE